MLNGVPGKYSTATAEASIEDASRRQARECETTRAATCALLQMGTNNNNAARRLHEQLIPATARLTGSGERRHKFAAASERRVEIDRKRIDREGKADGDRNY